MRVGVVGGGVVGLATGHYLQKLGADPIIVEAGGVGGGGGTCSSGSADHDRGARTTYPTPISSVTQV